MRVGSADIVDPVEFKISPGVGFDRDLTFWRQFDDGIVALHVRTVQRYIEGEKFQTQQCTKILVRAISEESGKSRKKCIDEFFADRVLEQISRGMSDLVRTNFTPIWHILLSFLYREGCWALVSILKGNGESCMGFLKPFTAHLALLLIIDNKIIIPDNVSGSKKDKVDEIPSKLGIDINNFKRSTDSKIGTSPSGICVPLVDGMRKKIKKHLLLDLTWNTFCMAAFEFSDLDLTEIYFARDCSKSKKLKFIKCWMRQIKKSSCYNHILPKSHQHIAKEIDERLTGTCQQGEQPICQQFSSELAGMQEGVALVSYSETAEAFFYNLHKKIQHGLEAEGVDLQIMAQRLVNSSIHWLRQKEERGNSLENQTPKLKNPCKSTIGTELIALLTRKPKELKEWNDSHTSIQASDQGFTSENIVREYELQILLRMEILQSEVAGTLVELTKLKLVKQICSLLEIIQYLEGGIHGHVSLYDYAERTIKTRYSHNLGDVVQRIYVQMDLLPCDEEDEPQLLLLNSEDSNQSWRDKQEELYEMADTKDIHKSVSLEDESSQPLEIADESSQGIRREEHALKLSEARKRRERARRFVSFTSWVPDLQRVWAPKQPKAGIVKSQSLSKESKRKERQMATYTVVCRGGPAWWQHRHLPMLIFFLFFL